MQDLYSQSEYTEIITGMMQQEYGKKVLIGQLHLIRMGDGNTVFYVVSNENYRFLVNIMGRKIQDNALLYWIENINYAGEMDKYYYDRDLFVITFRRGEKFNNEYLSYFYVYGNKYPAIRFVEEKVYPNYLKMLDSTYKKFDFKLPKEFTT